MKPKLRFPEFQNEPAWTETRLADVLTEHGLKNDGNSKVHSVSVHKSIIDQIEHLGRSFAAADTLKYNLVKPHDIVYTKSPTSDFPLGIVKQSRLEYNVIVSPLYGVFSPINKYLGYILDAYFESPIRTKNYLAPIVQKGAKNTLQITNETFLSKGLFLPSEEKEHKKIAECLTSLDALIDAHGQKLDALKSHKKGLMQQLFPRQGETIPRLRFPEFKDAPVWERKPMGNLLMSSPDYGVNAAAVPFSERLPKYLRITDISDDSTYLTDKMVSVDLEPTDGNYLDDGDIVLARTGASVGKSYRYRKEDGRLVFAGFLIRIKPDRTKLVPTFLANFLTTTQYWDWVAVTSARSGQPGINSTEYSALEIPLPPNNAGDGGLSEQQNIADCLSFLDELIAAQTEKLEALKTQKQGLMQQLFPYTVEVES